MSEPYALEIKDLSHSYDGTYPVFSDINLTIRQGEFMSILGASGCGKSTLLRAVAGLVAPQQGEIYIDDRRVSGTGKIHVPVQKRRIGMVFQDYALFPYQSVFENIGFGLRQLQRSDFSAYQHRVNELLDLIGMRALADRRPSELSGGQQQRVALARALAPRPDLLLLDEPFANIDVMLRQSLTTALQSLVKHFNVSVLLVTHDRTEAFSLADSVAMLVTQDKAKGARLLQCASPEEIYQRPIHEMVAHLAGPACFLQAQAHGSHAKTPLGDIQLIKPVHGVGKVMVRPEAATFVAKEAGTAQVIGRLFQGRSYRLLCKTIVGELLVDTMSQQPPDIGACGDIEFIQPCWLLGEHVI